MDEKQKLQNEIKQLLDKKLGKKYLCCLAYETELGKATSTVVGNVDFTKDPFATAKTLIAALSNATNSFVQHVMDVKATEDKPIEPSSYHQ